MSTIRPASLAGFLGLFFWLIIPIQSAVGAPVRPPVAQSASQPMYCALPIADAVSWSGFVRYWRNFVKSTDRVVLMVGIVAAAALFIITRGKWLK